MTSNAEFERRMEFGVTALDAALRVDTPPVRFTIKSPPLTFPAPDSGLTGRAVLHDPVILCGPRGTAIPVMCH